MSCLLPSSAAQTRPPHCAWWVMVGAGLPAATSTSVLGLSGRLSPLLSLQKLLLWLGTSHSRQSILP